jgi:hypothetical protein
MDARLGTSDNQRSDSSLSDLHFDSGGRWSGEGKAIESQALSHFTNILTCDTSGHVASMHRCLFEYRGRLQVHWN